MPTSNKDGLIVSYLDSIYAGLTDVMSATDAMYIREFIDVDEWGLALDSMAHLMLDSRISKSQQLYSHFEAAASLMKLKPGDRWTAVHELLAKG